MCKISLQESHYSQSLCIILNSVHNQITKCTNTSLCFEFKNLSTHNTHPYTALVSKHTLPKNPFLCFNAMTLLLFSCKISLQKAIGSTCVLENMCDQDIWILISLSQTDKCNAIHVPTDW